MWPRILLLALSMSLVSCTNGTLVTAGENEAQEITDVTSNETASGDTSPGQSEPTPTIPVTSGSGESTQEPNDGSNTDTGSNEVVSESDAGSSDSVCVVAAANLSTAKLAFESACPTASYRDCDEYPDGSGWACASGVIGQMGPNGEVGTTPYYEPPPATDIVIVGPPIDEPVQPIEPEPLDPVDPPVVNNGNIDVETDSATGWLFTQKEGHEGTGALEWRGANEFTTPGKGVLTYYYDIPTSGTYDFTIRSHITDGPGQAPQESHANNDVWLRVDGSNWTKVFQHQRGQWAYTLPFSRTLQAGTVEIQLSGRSQYFVIDTINVAKQGEITQPSGTDLILLHYDAAPDPDDLQAIIAGRAVTETLNIDPVVVVGAYGHDIGHRFINGSIAHATSLYPQGIEDAHNDRAGSVNRVRARIVQTLSNGGKVSIAEGGPSDFTYEVLSGINGLNLKNVTIVQHSHGTGSFNEGQTRATSLAWLKSNANYVTIGNGNAGQGTADFQHTRSTSVCQNFTNAALSSKYSSQWAYAFSLEVDDRYCDFSDTVELLHIIGDTTTLTLSDFESRYMRN